MNDRTWRKSSYSDDHGGSCLEVLDGHPTSVPVRDSKTAPHAPTLLLTPTAWTPFIEAVRNSSLHP
ncbi:DUF397 domain-containing protein [Streptomyces sp. NPDC004539]|uniref:DUF397 domain-containing protein n=1 Tax=Streptomyces sp. NPDC004539 TaxID=3154280 RepID=UPI0033AF69A3